MVATQWRRSTSIKRAQYAGVIKGGATGKPSKQTWSIPPRPSGPLSIAALAPTGHGVGAKSLTGCLTDGDLDYALELAGRIEDTAEAPLKKEALRGHARAWIGCCRSSRRYKKRKAKGEQRLGQAASGIGQSITRKVRHLLEQRLRGVEGGIKSVKRHIEACAEVAQSP